MGSYECQLFSVANSHGVAGVHFVFVRNIVADSQFAVIGDFIAGIKFMVAGHVVADSCYRCSLGLYLYCWCC
jgi:hypothetical protein